jgi:hypothetical protein
VPRLVVTLTMRPHFWHIMSWTRARDSAIGASLVCTVTKRSHCSGVTLSDPGIVDQNIDDPATAARFGDNVVNRPIAGEVDLDSHQVAPC